MIRSKWENGDPGLPVEAKKASGPEKEPVTPVEAAQANLCTRKQKTAVTMLLCLAKLLPGEGALDMVKIKKMTFAIEMTVTGRVSALDQESYIRMAVMRLTVQQFRSHGRCYMKMGKEPAVTYKWKTVRKLVLNSPILRHSR